MKKLLILQNEGKALGGIWFVNKSISEKLVELGYQVEILSIRNALIPSELVIDKRVKLRTVNETDLWGVTRKKEILQLVMKFKLPQAVKKYFKRLGELKVLERDYEKVRDYIRETKPDYILSTHYQLLDAIPKEFLGRTIHEQHTSFYATKMVRDNIRVFDKYKDKIKFVWLTKSTYEEASMNGYVNSSYIYNPVRFSGEKAANVVKNKKLITISRLSSEKRIGLMIDIVKDVFRDKKFKDWTFEIYGKGELESEILEKISDNKQIIFKGATSDPEHEFLGASINLNTSLFEGFCLGVIEGAYCGVPTVAFDFGESILEEIVDNKTGVIIPKEDIAGYKKSLKKLMSDDSKLLEMSKNCREFASQFKIDSIIDKWLELFLEIDKSN